MDKCKILIPQGCRSDFGLSKPIVKRLKEDDFFDVEVYKLARPGNFSNSYYEIESLVFGNCFESLPDLVFCTGDRIEMTAVACASFHHNVPIAHYYAGILNDPLSTLDDVNRHCISLWSDVQFVESKFCALNLENLFDAIGKRSNCFTVGITHMEDLEIDISLVPNEEYDLVLYNPTTLRKDYNALYIQERKVIVIGKNPDPDIFPCGIRCPTYENLPRPQFLGLLKNCERFITNSSSAIYEAPYFLKKEQIIIIGDRNKNRTHFEPIKSDKLASEKIIDILKQYWRGKQNEV